MIRLPTINFKGKRYTFDYNLKQLRTYTKKDGLTFFNISTDEADLLDYAIKTKDRKLIELNLKEMI